MQLCDGSIVPFFSHLPVSPSLPADDSDVEILHPSGDSGVVYDDKTREHGASPEVITAVPRDRDDLDSSLATSAREYNLELARENPKKCVRPREGNAGGGGGEDPKCVRGRGWVSTFFGRYAVYTDYLCTAHTEIFVLGMHIILYRHCPLSHSAVACASLHNYVYLV